MSTPATTPSLPIPAPPRRRRWRIALLLVALLVGVPAAYWGYITLTMRLAWEEAEAEAALDLPRWKLLELEADRPAIPDAENSALQVIKAGRQGGGFAVGGAANYDEIFANLPPNAELNSQQAQLLRRELARIDKALVEARKLKDMPRGRFPIQWSDDGIALIPEHQHARATVEWLQHDGWLRAQDQKYDEAVESSRAILNVARALEDEVSAVSFLIRAVHHYISLTTLERILAQGETSENQLRDVQEILGNELRASGGLQAMRAMRAERHQLFENIRSGKTKASVLGNKTGAGTVGSIENWLYDKFPSANLRHYPNILRYQNRFIEIAKLPNHEQVLKTKELSAELEKAAKQTSSLLLTLMSNVKILFVDCRSQAMLRSGLVAVACERYRLKHKEQAWPASLDDLVKAKLLDAIPLDPFDGKAIRYRRTKDGVVVYSIGFDLADNQGNINRDRIHDPGVDIGFRLWDVDQRRQSPLPPVAIPEK